MIAVAFALAITACKDEEEDDPPVDNPIQDRSGSVSIFGGTSTVTVKVMGMTTKAEWDDIANKIAGRLDTKFVTLNEPQQNAYKEVFARGVIYIVEPDPEGYSNCKTTGDGKTVYIALDKVDSPYVENAVVVIYGNETSTS